jgi:hypothetical protein
MKETMVLFWLCWAIIGVCIFTGCINKRYTWEIKDLGETDQVEDKWTAKKSVSKE